jgi:acetyl esterase/lipase
MKIVGGEFDNGPAFEFPERMPLFEGTALIEDVAQLLGSFNGWTTDELPGRSPIMAIVEDGVPISICFCARRSYPMAHMNEGYGILRKMALSTVFFIVSLLCCHTPRAQGAQNAAQGTEVDMSQFKKTIIHVAYAHRSYAEDLDIVYPEVGKGAFPLILVIHGGSWKVGNAESVTVGSILKATFQGYAVATINYRLSSEAKWPAQLYDAKAAVRFLRKYAKKYNLKADKIVAWGYSAGGQIAQMLGATNGLSGFEDLKMGNPHQSSSVQGVVSWYGLSDMAGWTSAYVHTAEIELMGFDPHRLKIKARSASPLYHITYAFPPTLLVHGTIDEDVPYTQSVKLWRKVNLIAGMGRARLKLIKGAGHGDDQIKTDENVKDDLYFVDEILWAGNNPNRSDKMKSVALKK